MLLGDFFFINSLREESNTIKAVLQLNTTHAVFDGHFPGQPVVPGVCMMQMIKEVTEKATGTRTRLVKAAEVKFLALIIPSKINLVTAEINHADPVGDLFSVTARLYSDASTHFKFKGSFQVVNASIAE